MPMPSTTTATPGQKPPSTQRVSSPSPPPPTHPPTSSLTPGPRAQALHSIFTSALTHTLHTCSYANFAACFPTPAAHAAPILESVWRQITRMIEEKSVREFEEILAEREVVAGLNELERIVAEAKGRKEKGEDGVAPHTLPPSTLHLAHLTPYLTSTSTSLNTTLTALQQENTSLASNIQAQEAEAEALIAGLEALVRDLEGANKVFEEEKAVEWRREAGRIDTEMGNT